MIYQIDPNETLCMALSGGGKGKTAISKTRKGKLTAQLPCSVFLDLHPENWLQIFKFVSLGQMVVVPQGASSRGWTEGKHVFTDVGQRPLDSESVLSEVSIKVCLETKGNFDGLRAKSLKHSTVNNSKFFPK